MRCREKVNFLACAGRFCLGNNRTSIDPLLRHLMIKAARIALSLTAVAGVGATFAACGGVPGNAVATVDGEAIEKSDFTHWMTVAAKSTGQANAAVPDPEAGYAKCIAAKRKATPAPAKGQPKVTDSQLKTQCTQEYEQLRNQVLQLLISFKWIQDEAETMDVKVTDAEVKKSFAEQKKQSFPKDEDYKKFIETSGQTEADILQRVKLDLLSNKIRDKVVKGKDTVSDKAIADFYNKNKARFAQPEKRDLRVVLTKGKADADKAKAALDSGDSWTKVAKKYSIDDTSKASGGKLPAQAKGTLDKELDDAVFSAEEGRARRSGQDPVRLLRLHGDRRHRRLAADAGGGQGDHQADAPVPEPADGPRQVRQGLHRPLEGKDGVLRGLQDLGLQERPEGHPDPGRGRAAGPGRAAEPGSPRRRPKRRRTG